MSDRKSSRSRKSISYAALDGESDDDFDTGPSSKKQKSSKQDDKRKKEKKDDSKKTSTSLPTRVPSSIMKRHTSFDRQLQQALEMSVQEHSASQGQGICGSGSNPGNNSETCTDFDVRDVVQVDIEPLPSAPHLERVEMLPDSSDKDLSPDPPELIPIMAPSFCGTVIDDTIEAMESETGGREKKPTREVAKRRQVSKKCLIDDAEDTDSEGGSDFAPGEESASDDDIEEVEEDDNFSPDDDDSDFDDGRKKKAKKTPKVKTSKKASDAVQTKSVSKPQPPALIARKSRKSPASERAESTKSPTHNVSRNSNTRKTPSLQTTSSSKVPLIAAPKPSSSASTRTISSSPAVPQTLAKSSSSLSSPSNSRGHASVSHSLVSRQWKPPSQATSSHSDSGSTVKSPSSGLRLGLSRNQRVKPLHDSVKVV